MAPEPGDATPGDGTPPRDGPDDRPKGAIDGGGGASRPESGPLRQEPESDGSADAGAEESVADQRGGVLQPGLELGEDPKLQPPTPPPARRSDRPLWLWLTAGGLGAFPIAPGTLGTVGGVILALPIQWIVLAAVGADPGVGEPGTTNPAVDPSGDPATTAAAAAAIPLGVTLLVLAAILTAATWPMSAAIRRIFGKEDPGAVVIDEVAGYLVTVAVAVLLTGAPLTLWGHGLAFLLFRLFDIAKVPLTWRLQKIPGAAGVLLDDIAAGVWAGLVMLPLASALPP